MNDFVLFAASTFVAGAALIGLGSVVMLHSGISERRRWLYSILAVVPGIAWLVYAAWTWDAHGPAFTIWAGGIGLAAPGLLAFIWMGLMSWRERQLTNEKRNR